VNDLNAMSAWRCHWASATALTSSLSPSATSTWVVAPFATQHAPSRAGHERMTTTNYLSARVDSSGTFSTQSLVASARCNVTPRRCASGYCR